MKPNTTTFCIACILTAGLTIAQEGERKPGGEGPNRMAEFLKKIDVNTDGKVSKEEFAEFSKKEGEERFAKIDGNADGMADEAEMKAAAEKMRSAAGAGGMRRPGAEGSPGEGGFRRPPEGQGKPERSAEERGMRRPEGGPPREEGGRPEGGPPGAGGPGGMMRGMGNPEEMIKRMDKNTDGGVDLGEFKEASSQELDGRFKMMDGNSDGKVSAEEMKQVAERMRNMMRGGQPGQPGQGGMRRPGGEGGSEGGGFRRPPTQDEGGKKPEGEKKSDGV